MIGDAWEVREDDSQLGGWHCHPLKEETLGEDQFHVEMRKLKSDRRSDKEAGVLKGPHVCWHPEGQDKVKRNSVPRARCCLGLRHGSGRSGGG